MRKAVTGAKCRDGTQPRKRRSAAVRDTTTTITRVCDRFGTYCLLARVSRLNCRRTRSECKSDVAVKYGNHRFIWYLLQNCVKLLVPIGTDFLVCRVENQPLTIKHDCIGHASTLFRCGYIFFPGVQVCVFDKPSPLFRWQHLLAFSNRLDRRLRPVMASRDIMREFVTHFRPRRPPFAPGPGVHKIPPGAGVRSSFSSHANPIDVHLPRLVAISRGRLPGR